MNNKQIAIVTIIASAFLLQSCTGVTMSSKSGYTIKNIQKYNSAINLAKNGTKELSGAITNIIASRPDKIEAVNNTNQFTTEFSIVKGSQVLYDNFDNYCKQIKGVYKIENKGALCFDKNNRNNAFFSLNVDVTKRLHNKFFLTERVKIRVIESMQPQIPSNEVLKQTDEHFKNSAIYTRMKESERVRTERVKKLNKLKNKAISTYSEVIKTGTKICYFSEYSVINDTGNSKIGNTERFANEKIQIRLFNGKIIWDDVANWYACQ